VSTVTIGRTLDASGEPIPGTGLEIDADVEPADFEELVAAGTDRCARLTGEAAWHDGEQQHE